MRDAPIDFREGRKFPGEISLIMKAEKPYPGYEAKKKSLPLDQNQINK